MKRHTGKRRTSTVALILALVITFAATSATIFLELVPRMIHILTTQDSAESETDDGLKVPMPPEEVPSETPTEEEFTTPTEVPSEENTDDLMETPTEEVTDDNGGYDPDEYLAIGTAEELMAFNRSVNEDGETYHDMTILLTDDIDLSGYPWIPLNGAAFDYTVFDGTGHTIFNMEIFYEPEEGTPVDQLGAGFIGASNGEISFQNITFENCHVTAYGRAVGCIVGTMAGGNATFEDVNVNNFTVDGWMDYHNQDRENGGHSLSLRSAGFIGHIMTVDSTAYFGNCHVENISISGFHNIAGFIGYASPSIDEYCFEECSVSNAEFTFSYCLADSYTVDMPRKFVSVFYNASNWADNVDFVVENGNSYAGVRYLDYTDNNTEYSADEFRSWTREEADAAA